MSDWDDRILVEPVTGLLLDLTDAPQGAVPPGIDPLAAMRALEGGAVANPDEGRQVGHYWLRDPSRAPSAAQQDALARSHAAVSQLRAAPPPEQVLWIGIGGSALGPQLLARWLAAPGQPEIFFLDNTDPDGIVDTLSRVDPTRAVAVVVSKSGGTPETRNGMLAAMAHWERAGEPFAPHAIAITGEGSRLDRVARAPAAPWRAVFPIWDWVGGRTSVTGPVGQVLLALLGIDPAPLLAGARAMDTRTREPQDNPALTLALSWAAAGQFQGDRALVVLPYRDRMDLLGRYLQQLIMESLGKRLDRQGREVSQGLTVYGNKGSTDQHAFVQQVRDGRDDCFVHFVDTEEQGPRVPVDDGRFADDHLLGFLLGTQAALREAGRPSARLQLRDCSARSLGAVIGLFERAVGLYAELIDINAYHQPGVEAGKRGARAALSELDRLAAALQEQPETTAALAARAGVDPRQAWRLLCHLAATGRAGRHAGARPSQDRFGRAGRPSRPSQVTAS